MFDGVLAVAGEAQPLLREPRLQLRTEPWLKEGDIALLNAGNSVLVDVHADHIVAHFGEDGRLH